MRILMLGNSYTFYHDMPDMLAELTGAEVVAHTRGGAHLAEQLNPETKMGASTLESLEHERWDFVIMQEMSNAPVTSKDSFMKSVSCLCEKIHSAGAVPILYATWAYKEDGEKMDSMDITYEQMYQGMYSAYHEAAKSNQALIADVGKKFYELSKNQNLYEEDGSHPNEDGSRIGAKLLSEQILTASGKQNK